MALSRFFRRARWDEERARELEAYLAEEIDEALVRGMSRDAAVFAAHRKLGNIRMALGADPPAVVRMVLGESALLLAVGVVAGVGLAILASRSAASILYGLEPWDPVSIAAAVAVLGTVSFLAAWVPARRASRLPPTIALRE